MTRQNIHLNEDQLIRAVVDAQDLPAEIRQHLASCPMCREKKHYFETVLSNLEEMTETFSPLPQRKITLPDHQPFLRKIRWLAAPLPAFAAGLALFLLMLNTWYPGPGKVSDENLRVQVVREAEDAPQLITEISALEEYTLPDIYQDISGESYGYFDNEFMDFIVPTEEKRIDAFRSDWSRA